MSNNPNDIKSQDDTRAVQDKRSVDVLVHTIEKCEKLQKQLKIAIEDLYVIAHNGSLGFNYIEYATKSLEKIKELEKWV